MPYETRFVGYGPFKKKSLDYIIPAEVFRFFAGKKPSKTDISNYITELVHGTAEIKNVISPSATASTPSQNYAPEQKKENAPLPKVEIPAPKPLKDSSQSEILQLKKRSTLSISNIMSQKEKKTVTAVKEVKTRPFTVSELSMLWSAFAEKEKKNGHIGLHTAMNGADIHLDDKNMITITASSVVVASEIENNILDILEYLKRELQNDTITHTITITDVQRETLPYTPGEKYTYLTKKNRELEKLRNTLGLSIEF
ncbi:MAG: hypothetical protein PHD21_01850 [Flavobacteriales bacterium]|nr:hypothetical protein [Flavobacteriales bacterium]